MRNIGFWLLHAPHTCVQPPAYTCTSTSHMYTHHIFITYMCKTPACSHTYTSYIHILPTYTSHTWTQAPACTCAYIAHKYTHTHTFYCGAWRTQPVSQVRSGHPSSTNQLKQLNKTGKANVATLGSGTERAGYLPCLCSRS